MNTFKITCCYSIFLSITAGDIQAQITPQNNIQETAAYVNQAAFLQVMTGEQNVIASVENSRACQTLYLSIDVVVQDQSNNDVMFFIDNAGEEANSDLFDGLSRKYPDQNLKLSGELLTDDKDYETKEFLKSVNGVQINVQGKFD